MSKLAEAISNFRTNIFLSGDSGRVILYSNILELSQNKVFKSTYRRLVMCSFDNDVDAIAGYMGLLLSGAVPLMVSPSLPKNELDRLTTAYEPDFLWARHENKDRFPEAECCFVSGSYALFCLNDNSKSAELT